MDETERTEIERFMSTDLPERTAKIETTLEFVLEATRGLAESHKELSASNKETTKVLSKISATFDRFAAIEPKIGVIERAYSEQMIKNAVQESLNNNLEREILQIKADKEREFESINSAVKEQSKKIEKLTNRWLTIGGGISVILFLLALYKSQIASAIASIAGS